MCANATPAPCREQEGQESLEQAVQKAADELIQKFEEQWAPAMENLQEADAAFDDLDGARLIWLSCMHSLGLQPAPAPGRMPQTLLLASCGRRGPFPVRDVC